MKNTILDLRMEFNFSSTEPKVFTPGEEKNTGFLFSQPPKIWVPNSA